MDWPMVQMYWIPAGVLLGVIVTTTIWALCAAAKRGDRP